MSYKEGIILAITELKDRNGSSMIAIKKHMQGNLPKTKKWINGTFLKVLKTGVANGEFVQIKNSYKLSPEFKKKVGKKPAAVAAKKTTTKKAPVKKAAPKKKASAKAVRLYLYCDSVCDSCTVTICSLHLLLLPLLIDHQEGQVCSQEEGNRCQEGCS